MSNEYDWVRNPDGTPKKMKSGNYCLVKDNSIYFGIDPKNLIRIWDLLNEMEEAEDEN
jgi:hypothetical protein